MAVDQNRFEQTLDKILAVRVDHGEFGPDLRDALLQTILWSIRSGPDKVMRGGLSPLISPDGLLFKELSDAQMQRLRDEHRAYVNKKTRRMGRRETTKSTRRL